MPKQRWLMKTEPETFSIDHLERVGTEPWSGVRNYQARNFMKAMERGDLALFYHSSATPSGVAGVCEIVRTAYPDFTALDPRSPYFDPKATAAAPRWEMVDVRFVQRFARFLPLDELRAIPALAAMVLFQRSRLSVQPVPSPCFELIVRLGG